MPEESTTPDLEGKLRGHIEAANRSQRGRPRAGGSLVEKPYAAVVAWKDRLIVRVGVYPEIDEARAAAERLAQDRR